MAQTVKEENDLKYSEKERWRAEGNIIIQCPCARKWCVRVTQVTAATSGEVLTDVVQAIMEGSGKVGISKM